MSVNPSSVFIGLTSVLVPVGLFLLGFRPYAHRARCFFLGAFVMSFAGIWICLI